MFLSVEVAKNPEADHASARWHSLPSDVPFLGPEGPRGYQVKPEARPHREPSTMKSVEAAVAQSFHLFGAFAGITAGATEKEASCHSTGERSNRWPFAAAAQSGRLVFATPLIQGRYSCQLKVYHMAGAVANFNCVSMRSRLFALSGPAFRAGECLL